MIKVLIVDDSAVVRKVLADELTRYPDIRIVGTAVDPYMARDKIVKLRPDVITLDLEMPRMDGLSFLAKLMKFYPLPVVVLSSLTPKNSQNALKALDLGAVAVLCKPGSAYGTSGIAAELARAVRGAANANVRRVSQSEVTAAPSSAISLQTTHKIIAIGASTGGTKAIETVLRGLPSTAPGTVIVQHMPEHFTSAFASRLNEVVPMEVREAKDGDHVLPGLALIAPGNKHMLLERSGGTYLVRIKDGPRVHYQRPSVDVLFFSVAKAAEKNAVAALLTGMGADGAKGLVALKESGAFTVAQDEESCVVFGMPKEAIKLGGAEKVAPLEQIAQVLINSLRERG